MKFIGIKNKKHVFEIEDKNGEYIIGRADDCDIVMKFKGVSAQHCRLFIRDNQFALIDLGSSNGTLVNGARIKRKMLNPKDIVQIGVEKFNVVLSDEAQAYARKRKKADAEVKTAPPEILTVSNENDNKTTEETTIEKRTKLQPAKKLKSKGKKQQVKEKKEVLEVEKRAISESVSRQTISPLWLIIFFVGGILGLALFIVGMVMKSSSDEKIQDLINEIASIKRENTTLQSKMEVVKTKFSDIKSSFTNFTKFVEGKENQTFQLQREVSTDVDEVKNSRTKMLKQLDEILTKIEKLHEDIESIND